MKKALLITFGLLGLWAAWLLVTGILITLMLYLGIIPLLSNGDLRLPGQLVLCGWVAAGLTSAFVYVRWVFRASDEEDELTWKAHCALNEAQQKRRLRGRKPSAASSTEA